MRHATQTSAALLAALLLSSCAFGPSGTAPVLPSPAHYGVAPTPATTVAAAGAAQRFALGARPVPDWWHAYRNDTLNALVDEGLRNSASLAEADATLAAAREQLRAQVGESLWPTLDAGGQTSRQRALGVPVLPQPTALYDLFVGQLKASYTIDLFGAARLANASLAGRVDIQSYQLDAARRALAANIVTAIVNSAALHEQLDASERLAALADAQAQDTEQRYQLGGASRLDALSARQNARAIETTLPALRTQWQALRHTLAVLLGRTPDQAPPDLPLASLHLPDDVPVSVPSDLLAQRPDILAADAGLKVAAANVGIAEAQMLPSLSLNASIGQGGFNWTSATGAAGALWSVGASLSAPVFHGGALRAQKRAAEHEYDAALAQYRQTVLAAFQDVANALGALEHDAQALAAAAAASDAARQGFVGTAARYRLGAVPHAAALASEQQYQNARVTEIRSIGARLADTAALFQAMGVVREAPPRAANPTVPLYNG